MISGRELQADARARAWLVPPVTAPATAAGCCAGCQEPLGAEAGVALPALPKLPGGLPVPKLLTTLTQGANLQMPAIPGVTGKGGIFSIKPHQIPGVSQVMDKLGLPAGLTIPTDVESAVKMGIQIGTQVLTKLATPLITSALTAIMPGVVSAVSSTLATLGTATGLGSMIPGVGNLVGVAIAGLIELGKMFAADLEGPRQCEFDPRCPDIARRVENLSPVDALPILAKVYADTSMRLSRQAREEDCVLLPMGGGAKVGPYGCMQYILGGLDTMLTYSQPTVVDMGLPQLNRVLPLYQAMPKHGWYVDVRGSQKMKPMAPWGERQSRVRDWTTRDAVRAAMRGQTRSRHDLSVSGMIKDMGDRRLFLAELDRKIQGAATIAPGQVSGLRWHVVTELRKATTQYMLNQGPEQEQWLRHCGLWLQKVMAREAADKERMKRHLEMQRRRAKVVEADPVLRRKMAIEQLKFLYGQGDERAGKRIRELMAGAPLLPHEGTARPGRGPAKPKGPSTAAWRMFAAAVQMFTTMYLLSLGRLGNRHAAQLIAAIKQQPGLTPKTANAMAWKHLDAQAKAGNRQAQIVMQGAKTAFGPWFKLAAAAIKQRRPLPPMHRYMPKGRGAVAGWLPSRVVLVS